MSTITHTAPRFDEIRTQQNRAGRSRKQVPTLLGLRQPPSGPFVVRCATASRPIASMSI